MALWFARNVLVRSDCFGWRGGTSSATNKTYIVRTRPGDTRVVEQVDVKKVLNSRVGDPIVHEDDIIYISPSPLKVMLKGALAFALAISPTLLYLR